MVIEFLEVAAGAVEGAFLASDVSYNQRNNTRGAPRVPVGGAVLAGLVTGAFAHNEKVAGIGSLLAGAALPFLSHGKATVGSIAMTAITSTAVGLVTFKAKESWKAHVAAEKLAKHPAEAAR